MPAPMTEGYCPADLKRVRSRIANRRFFFDRCHVLLPSAEPDLALEKIGSLCGGEVKLVPVTIKYQPQYKTRLELFQPSRAGLLLLQSEIGQRFNYSISYLEIAIDLITRTEASAKYVANYVKRTAWIPRMRKKIKTYEGTTYWGDRSGAWTLVAYSDKPSKITNAPCAHVEVRARGAEAVARLGVSTLADVAHMPLKEVMKRHLRLSQLVSRVALGSECKGSGSRDNVSRQALIKRANRFLSEKGNSLGGEPIVHNLRLECREAGMDVEALFVEIDNVHLLSN